LVPACLPGYYLAVATDENLRREARKKFKAAKEVEGFKAPEKFYLAQDHEGFSGSLLKNSWISRVLWASDYPGHQP